MAKEYKVGEKYYLPVTVEEVVNTNHGVKIGFEDGAGKDTTRICDEPDILLTEYEIASKVRYRRNIEQENRLAELEAENDLLKANKAALSEKNDELETTVSELSVLVDKLRREMAQREELWGNVSNNNDIAKVNLNRLCKQREVLTDRIIALEAELEEEREKHNG